MQRLSPYVLDELIWDGIRNQKDGASDLIKNIVCSCPQLSYTFDIVMQNIWVEYSGDCYIFRVEKGANVGIYRIRSRGHWMAPFIRKLAIKRHPEEDDMRFFIKIFHCNNLKELNVLHLRKEIILLKEFQNLISITRKLKICAIDVEQSFDYIQKFVSRCETIFFSDSKYNPNKLKQFEKTLNLDPSVLLELNYGRICTAEECSYTRKALNSDFQHIRRIYFACCVSDFFDIKKLIGDLKIVFPNTEKISLAVQLILNGKRWNSLTNCLEHVKLDFNNVAAILREIPSHIKSSVFYVLSSNFYYRDSILSILIDRIFSSQNFVVTSNDSSRAITIRPQKLQENVEFIYRLEFDGRMS